ncbi:MAG: hypothetical protein Q7J67_05040 [bacterium]|nr:hypothetical protein [bacterium]
MKKLAIISVSVIVSLVLISGSILAQTMKKKERPFKQTVLSYIIPSEYGRLVAASPSFNQLCFEAENGDIYIVLRSHTAISSVYIIKRK